MLETKRASRENRSWSVTSIYFEISLRGHDLSRCVRAARMCARANDTKIVCSRESQYSEESP